VSLIDGPFPWLLLAVAVLSLAAVPVSRARSWFARSVPVAAGVALVVTVLAVFIVHQVPGLIGDATDEYPFVVNVIVFLGVAVAVVVGLSWGASRSWQRIVGVVAAVSMIAVAGDRLAIRYGYPPDLRALLGLDVRDARRFDPTRFPTVTTTPSSSAPDGRSTVSPTSSADDASDQTPDTVSDSGPDTVVSVEAPPRAGAPVPLERRWSTTSTLAAKGQIYSGVDIPGTVSAFKARTAYVYLPPAYFATPRPALPVMVLLAGVPGQPKNWFDGLDTPAAADAIAHAHKGLAPILVFADYTGGMTADKGCIDSTAGKIETYLTVDVPQFIQRTFGPDVGPAHWGIGGFSDGGTCAVTIGLRHPDRFGVIASFSCDLGPNDNGSVPGYVNKYLEGDARRYDDYDPIKLLQGRHYPDTTVLYLEAGTGERSKKDAAQRISDTAHANHVRASLVTRKGGHNFTLWRHCVVDSMPWIAKELGLIE
jgi:S-formylglutathione hydrolase FrmB